MPPRTHDQVVAFLVSNGLLRAYANLGREALARQITEAAIADAEHLTLVEIGKARKALAAGGVTDPDRAIRDAMDQMRAIFDEASKLRRAAT